MTMQSVSNPAFLRLHALCPVFSVVYISETTAKISAETKRVSHHVLLDYLNTVVFCFLADGTQQFQVSVLCQTGRVQVQVSRCTTHKNDYHLGFCTCLTTTNITTITYFHTTLVTVHPNVLIADTLNSRSATSKVRFPLRTMPSPFHRRAYGRGFFIGTHKAFIDLVGELWCTCKKHCSDTCVCVCVCV